jgi:hypothetical protein
MAMKLASKAEGAPAELKAELKLPSFKGLHWGFAVVEYYGLDRELYEPQPKGEPAVIVPVIEDGDTVDLAAISLVNQHVGRRMGFSRGLGMDAIERARWGGCQLHLVPRPLTWVRRQETARAQAVRFIRAVHHRMQHPKDQTGDESLPDDFTYLFDIHKAVAILDGVAPERITVDGEAFYDHVYRLFPPSVRDQLKCRA